MRRPRTGPDGRRQGRYAYLTAALPIAFLCTLPGQAPQPEVEAGSIRYHGGLPSVGGGPPGGVRTATRAATPGAYRGCGRGARPETGLQGQVPPEDQASGRSKEGYRCNLRLVGENTIENRGANFQLGWYRDCAYVGTVGAREFQTEEGDELDGVAVIDASDPRRPELVRLIREPGGVTQHEGVEVNRKRGMLVVQTGGLSARYIDIYDVSENCRRPVFRGRYDAGRDAYHGLRISRDGRTVYASDYLPRNQDEVLHVIDVRRMAKPRLLMKWGPALEEPRETYGIHDLELSRDGNRAYLGAVTPSAVPGSIGAGPPSNTGPTMVVLDTSDFQERRRNPDPEVVSDVRLPNFGHTEIRARIDGKPYIFTSGETPFGGADNCPWAWGNVVDMSDEKDPKVVADIKLEVNELQNCPAGADDDEVYSIHYAGVDNPRNTKLLFYTYYTGGVRVFDVRDPRKPKEIAYYHPPPVPDTVHPPVPINAGDNQTPTWDSATSDVRYRPKKRQLWFVSVGRGFQVLKLRKPSR